MADDQRPYRSNDTIARGGQAKPTGSDPLAELARLIGQSDPFGEYARDNARRPAAPPAAPATDWSQPQQQQSAGYAPHTMAPEPHQAETQAYAAPGYGQQGYYQPAGTDAYATENQIPAYLTQRGEAAGHAAYDAAPYDPANAPYSAEHDDYYDDAPPSRRRMGILVIAGVFALAVLGTAGAFGYRALFGSSSGGQPPVIRADTAPSKVVPAGATKDAASNKLITDRVGGASSEKLVSREEQPIEMRDKPAGVVFPGQRDTSSTNVAAMGSGVVGSEPKKIRTIAIHPDGSAAVPDATPSAMPMPEPPRQAPPPPQRTASAPPAPAPAPAARAPAPPPTAAPAPSNAPLSLNPNAPAAQTRAAAPAPARTASAPTQLAPAPASGGGSGAFVQVSSQRSEADAQAAFRALQGRFPDQLGSRQPVVHRADLGAKGIYFRAMVGPLAGSEATELCSSLKAAGGSCIIQRN